MSVSEEDIQILIDQGNITREIAKKLIVFKGGDLVESILEIEKHSNTQELEKYMEEEYKEVKQKKYDEVEKEVDVSNRDNLSEYRNIIDEKDTIYNYKSEQKEKQKKKNKLIEERREKGESVDDLLQEKLSNEDIYYSGKKGNFNNIRVL